MVNISELDALNKSFLAAIEKEEFDVAATIYRDIDNTLKAIDDYSSLDEQTLQWLNKFNVQITKNISVLQQKSQVLVDKIKPFNDNKKTSVTYSND